MNTDATDWLVREVRDLLDVSSVGLYEFLDMLRTPDLNLSDVEREPVARRALARLMAEPGTQLKQLRWPTWDSLGTLDLEDLPTDAWHAPDENGIYYAIDRAE